ncbi:hypothetical protein [Leucobacter sp. M11]|uniref:hypothetical protein n=1 Tax=Leucobacter sp. M11 TaxID=2993565 RepID=UPI002D8001BE|nr:hypothetical protein [Leucobacter sp. M11]MEB4614511.1 hypothetical protein [Leucobacter sp. M11]
MPASPTPRRRFFRAAPLRTGAVALALVAPLALAGCVPAEEAAPEESVLDLMMESLGGDRQSSGLGLVVGGVGSMGLSSFVVDALEPGQTTVADLIVAIEQDPDGAPTDSDPEVRADAIVVSAQLVCEGSPKLSPSAAVIEIFFGEPGEPTIDPGLNLGELCASGAAAEDIGSAGAPGAGFGIPVTFRLPATLPDGDASQAVQPEELQDAFSVLIEVRDATGTRP